MLASEVVSAILGADMPVAIMMAELAEDNLSPTGRGARKERERIRQVMVHSSPQQRSEG